MPDPKDLWKYAYVVGPPYPITIISFSIHTMSDACFRWLTSCEFFEEDGTGRAEIAGVDGSLSEHHARMLSFARGNAVNLELCSQEQLYRYLDIATIWGTAADVEGIQHVITANTALPNSDGPVPMIAHFCQLPKHAGHNYDRDLDRAEEFAKYGAEVEEAYLTVCHAWFEPPGPSPFSTRTEEERAIIVTATVGQIALYLSQNYLVCMILPLNAWERTGRGQVIRHVLLIGERQNEEAYT